MEETKDQLHSGINDWDAVDAWFECITRCSVDATDDCVTACMRLHLGEDKELWLSSFCP